jgi:hypothetical protein
LGRQLPLPFSDVTEWTVSNDGTIAIAFPDPYRVEFLLASGRRTRSRTLANDRVRISEELKDEWRATMSEPQSAVVVGRGTGSEMTMIKRPVTDPPAWPRYLAPFPKNALRFDADGNLWIRRSTDAGKPPLYDVVRRDGSLWMKVQLPQRARVVGFDSDAVFVAQVTDDGLEHLQRHRLRLR